MPNVTLKVDDALLREARILASKRGTSVSRLVAQQLEKLVREEKAYARHQRHALNQLREGYDLGWSPPDDRSETHER